MRRAFSAALTRDVPSVAARIAVELRNSTFSPTTPRNQARDGKYRKVKLLSRSPVALRRPLLVTEFRRAWDQAGAGQELDAASGERANPRTSEKCRPVGGALRRIPGVNPRRKGLPGTRQFELNPG